jgi:hypothetical protein
LKGGEDGEVDIDIDACDGAGHAKMLDWRMKHGY